MEVFEENDLSGHMTMLGSQRWVGTRRGALAELFAQAIEAHLPGPEASDLMNSDNEYSATCFGSPVFSKGDSFDCQGLENASSVQGPVGSRPNRFNRVHHAFHQINPEMADGFWEITMGCALQPGFSRLKIRVLSFAKRLAKSTQENGCLALMSGPKPQELSS